MHFHVLIMVRLGRRQLAANMTNVRLLSRMHFLVLRQVIAARKQLPAHVALMRPRLGVLPRMPNAVVLAYKLASAHVARIRPLIVVRPQVRVEVRLVYVRLHAQLALVRLRRPRHMREPVQLQVPLRAERLRALAARVLLHAFVYLHVRRQRRVQKRVVAHRALDHVLQLLRAHPRRHVRLVVPLAYVPRQTRHVHEAFRAERALLRLLVVYLLVPQQLHLAVKHLAALAHEILPLTLVIHVQKLLVLLVVRVAFERAVAHVALDRRRARVHVHVLAQLLLRHERLAARVARVRLHLHVPLLVQHVAGPRVERLAARHALVRVHLADVLAVRVGRLEPRETRRTHAAAAFDVVLAAQMLDQRVRRFENAAALAAADFLHRRHHRLPLFAVFRLHRVVYLDLAFDAFAEQRLDRQAVLFGVLLGDMLATRRPRVELATAEEASKFALRFRPVEHKPQN